ncbi:flagellar hook-associated protein 3 [Ammonifex degensii KC4]|uniref:Flagellar hook-associated protein 3 n=1 Tax=Ammonifex degensii (strain DSM 10501 / KC4) TaxID=429009 RepID=C9RAZ1_AMMDK|nr:flagellar hook-associated protein FlgL [Ammonifex degensii]ACX51418.1 flagellar hook-associated protein 3 [Ammonifex degensii KC4]
MRVTTNMLVTNFLRNLNSRLDQIAKRQEELASGRRLNRPSDDPTGVMSALRLRAQLAENQQYHKNMADAVDWLNATEAALRDALATVQRVRELAVAGASDALPQGAREALAQEVEELKEHLGNIANTTYGGRYIFAGTRTDLPPYSNGSLQSYPGGIEYEIAPATTIKVNTLSSEAFSVPNATANKDIFEVLNQLSSDLRDGKTQDISNQRLQELDQSIDNLLKVLAEVGAKVKRLEMGMERLETNEADLTRLLSQTEDADMARTIVDLKTQENVYRAALAVGARLLQPSLVDFLS